MIDGGKPLSGRVAPDGAKNSSLYALIAATFINEGWMTIENVPLITDIKMTLGILDELGMQYKVQGTTVKVYGKITNTIISDKYASKIRSSTTFLGALLSQFPEVILPLPGGDKIGDRPIDIHISVMEAYGASISIEGGFIKASLDTSQLTGKDIHLRYPSVGATINAIFMAITAQGQSTITNAAREPEIVDLISLLGKMGAVIHGGGTNRIVINGVRKLTSTTHDIMPDRLETGALMMCFAMTGGKGSVYGSIPEHNEPLIHLLRSIGIQVDIEGDTIHIDAHQPSKSFHIETQPYPGLATDLQAICTSLALKCPGTSTIKDTVFEERFGHIEELRRMGARIERNGNKIFIHNGDHITGSRVEGGDIRSVVSLILVALSIKDKSYIGGIEHLLRGHVNFVNKIIQLEADAEFI
nr:MULTISPECIES: UDP-N-acetylglucosamine 1-carboxyvinyltransferase [unclassified Fusibacter]